MALRKDSKGMPREKNSSTQATCKVSCQENSPPKIPYTRRTTGTRKIRKNTVIGKAKKIIWLKIRSSRVENSSVLPWMCSFASEAKDAMAKEVPNKFKGKDIRRIASWKAVKAAEVTGDKLKAIRVSTMLAICSAPRLRVRGKPNLRT